MPVMLPCILLILILFFVFIFVFIFIFVLVLIPFLAVVVLGLGQSFGYKADYPALVGLGNGEFIALVADKLIMETAREKNGRSEIQNVI